MAAERLEVGLVGCGHWGVNILRDLVALGCRVHVVDPALDAAALPDAASVVSNLRSLVPVAGLIVATPIQDHAATTLRALERDVPVFVEKPLTADRAAAQELVVRGAGRVFMMDKWRYHPGVATLRRIAADGELGVVRAVHTTRHSPPISQRDVSCLWVLAPHDVSIIEMIAGGSARPTSATAYGAPSDWAGIRAEVQVGSVLGTIDVSVVEERTIRRVSVVGSSGTATLPSAQATGVLVEREGTTEVRPVVGPPPLFAELETFVAYLHGGPAPEISVAHGAHVVDVLAEIEELANTGFLDATVRG